MSTESMPIGTILSDTLVLGGKIRSFPDSYPHLTGRNEAFEERAVECFAPAGK
jgi:hypothetical protein